MSQVQTPMNRLKGLFENLDKKITLKQSANLHRRVEKRHSYSWETHVRKKIDTDFIRILELPKNKQNALSLAFSFDYVDIETKITTSIDTIKSIQYSKVYSFEEFRDTLRSLVKKLPEKCDADTFLTHYLETFTFENEEKNNQNIEEDILTVQPLIEQIKLAKKNEKSKNNKLIKTLTQINKDLSETPEYLELQTLLGQQKELEKLIKDSKKQVELKTREIENNHKLSHVKNELNDSTSELSSLEKQLEIQTKAICSKHPKNQYSAIRTTIDNLKN